MSSREELVARFHQIAKDVTEREIPLMSENTVISDLGIDSLAMLEIVGEMERAFKIRIPDDQLVGISTVAQLVELVHKRLPAA